MTPEQEAKHVKEIIDNPAYQAAIARVKGNYYSDLVDSGYFQRRKREYIYKMMRVIVDFEVELRRALNDGLIAAKNKPKIED
jgi:hypothetical protein